VALDPVNEPGPVPRASIGTEPGNAPDLAGGCEPVLVGSSELQASK